MPGTSSPRRWLWAPLLLALAVGCTAGEETSSSMGASGTSTAGTSTAGTSTAGTSTAGTSTSASDPASDAPSSRAERAGRPARGPATGIAGFTAHVPRGWRLGPPDSIGQSARGRSGTMFVSSLPSIAWVSLTRQARAHMDSYMYIRPRRQPDRRLDGVKVYHVAGGDRRGGRFDSLGTITAGRTIWLEIQSTLPPGRHRRLVASVLASWRWD